MVINGTQEGIHKSETERAVIASLPGAIQDLAITRGEISFSLFKATCKSGGRVKLIPHGHQRLPHLINNVKLSEVLVEELGRRTLQSAEFVRQVLTGYVDGAKAELLSGNNACFTIPGLCRVYLDQGKIRVTTSKM